MVRFVPSGVDPRASLLAEVARAAAAAPGAPEGVEAFVHRYYARVAVEDLQERSVEYLAGAARAHLDLARTRPPGVAVVRVHTPVRATHGWESPHTLVQIVNDDMPFLVDSVSMELRRHGLGLHLVVHPILRVRRDPGGALVAVARDDDAGDGLVTESFLAVEVDRETSPEVVAAVHGDLERVLGDVRLATGDWLKMLARLRRVIDGLRREPPPIDPDDLAEGTALLAWLADQHFTFLGAREYDLQRRGDEDVLVPVAGTGLGILRNAPEVPSASFAALPPDVRAHARDRELLVLTKANRRATVHRPVHLDYVGVRRFDPVTGEVIGEHRFLGLYTSAAYNASPVDVPVLRRKVAAVVARAGFLPSSHDHKDLIEILESYPRDDLFQIDVDRLYEIAMGILQLQERRRVRCFVHRETWGRFVSVLVFLPRDRYTTQVREAIAGVLTDAFGAHGHDWNARLSESVLARLHFVLRVDPHDRREVDLRALEERVGRVTRLWVDDLRDALVASRGEEAGLELLRTWGEAFPAAYRDDFTAADAVADIGPLERLTDDDPLAVRLSERPDGSLALKVYGIGAQPSLSDVLPRLTNLGVGVDDERPYDVRPAGGGERWIKHFHLRVPAGSLPVAAVRAQFEEAFLAVSRGEAEDDGFNRLVLAAGCTWREVSLLRAYSRLLRQIGTPYSQPYVEDALVAHPDLARRLVELFLTRLDPWTGGAGDTERLTDELMAGLDAVTSLDEDRILRSLAHLVLATLRTNWFQTDDAGRPRPVLALKLDPTRVPECPKPRPLYEVFVYSPRVEGVHLRAAKVARGGIRWSDRREDYRTEVLGLMKAQRVKNAVIVPGGAKGGFVVKQPPAGRDALAAEVEACYRLFVAGLLDVTDNLVDGTVVPPPQVVRYDGDDPYLVVAADKGTATFSDVANEIALARGFWLGDAFASGGSTGYDHKKMGITARGAWESVKRHFRELGVDVQTTDFTVAGIGDMSGDVFGNGMLLSEHIRLVAAFDHRHVFLDPDPDPAASFAERKRLFGLPRSSWDDYDRDLISAGGGVYPRSAKSIPVSPQVRARLAIPDPVEHVTPAEMIRHILRAPVDLLWNGGIGTYVKASGESHADVGDKANDPVRVDGRELRCRVVAEGGNLGLTQLGRVEYALAGGRINTDAIDNSAGVDASDHEVNIKVLLDAVVAAGELSPADRNALLREMTDEVAELVLRDNYRQNRALANAQAQAAAMEDVHARFIRALEQAGDLDRAVERLPSDEALAERHNAGLGLTQPELAVLLAYAKITLEDEILASGLPDDPDFAGVLADYFPRPVRERYGAWLDRHPLRREIVATTVVNGMVNRAGTTFAFRLGEETGASAEDVVRAHEVARAVFGQDDLWRRVEALDNLVAASTQTDMYLESRKLVERASRWLLRRRNRPLPVGATVAALAGPVARAVAALPAVLGPQRRARVDERAAGLAAQGVPVDLARTVALLDPAYAALDVADLAASAGRAVEEVTELYCVVGERLRIDWLRDLIVALPRGDRWQALSRGALRDDADAEHRAVTAAILASTEPGTAGTAAFEAWAGRARATVDRALALLDDIRAHGVYDLTTLSVALREIRALA
ncbi:MAG: NAD-glutamate dehydrogenase [Acidimicrobiia bacterium]|nr:MAG: NAD-glutamate dehydrogenase [Acidimicrobiia bacterium]